MKNQVVATYPNVALTRKHAPTHPHTTPTHTAPATHKREGEGAARQAKARRGEEEERGE